MKKLLGVLYVFSCFLLANSCSIINAISIMDANSRINESTLSIENEIFQQESEINLTYVKRSLWSIQHQYNNKKIKSYYESLMENKLTYLLNENDEVSIKQEFIDDEIKITINNQYLNYPIFQNSLLLAISTSTLALLNDEKYDNTEAIKMFFKFFDDYDDKDMQDIKNTKWFKEKNIRIITNGIIIQE